MTDRPAGDLRVRSAEVVGVSFPERILELIVIPYEKETLVPHPRDSSRMVTEIISRGAFDGIERRANRIRVNRDHDLKRTVGRAVAFHSHAEGLLGQVRISRTELGDETLQLADDGILDASAGFLPIPPDGERWETRNRCRIDRGWLGHIAMTPDPAYEGARVLAVRNAAERGERPVTPNLEQLRLQQLEDAYAVLDSRYSPRQH